jgi:hypothetical protein
MVLLVKQHHSLMTPTFFFGTYLQHPFYYILQPYNIARFTTHKMNNTSDNISLNMPHILELPDEILSNIVNNVALSNTVTTQYERRCEKIKKWQDVCRTIFHISLTNRRFNRVAIPQLYSNLQINCTDSEIDLARVKTHLHENFQKYPSLRSYCHSLEIAYRSTKYGDQFAYDFVNWLTAVRSLTIVFLHYSGMPSRTFKTALKQMPNCKDLTFSSSSTHAGSVNLLWVVESLHDFSAGFLPNLQTLTIVGGSIYRDSAAPGRRGCSHSEMLRILKVCVYSSRI